MEPGGTIRQVSLFFFFEITDRDPPLLQEGLTTGGPLGLPHIVTTDDGL